MSLRLKKSSLTSMSVALTVVFGLSFASNVRSLAFQDDPPRSEIKPKPVKHKHKRSKWMPYIPKKPFVITIENERYNKDSLVDHATVYDLNANKLYYWKPFKDNKEKKGQQTNGNRISVVFDTNPLYELPGLSKIHKRTFGGSGTILVITTNLENDDPPSDEDVILLDQVDIDPCPPM